MVRLKTLTINGVTYTVGPQVSSVVLRASAWEGSDGAYSQVVEVDGVTPYTKVDLQPSLEQIEIFHEKDIAFTTENNNGIVRVHVVGDKPQNDYTIQVTLKEVVA